MAKFFRLILSPSKLITYFQLQAERRDRFSMLCRVTSVRSAQDLHDKIRVIDDKIAAL